MHLFEGDREILHKRARNILRLTLHGIKVNTRDLGKNSPTHRIRSLIFLILFSNQIIIIIMIILIIVIIIIINI